MITNLLLFAESRAICKYLARKCRERGADLLRSGCLKRVSNYRNSPIRWSNKINNSPIDIASIKRVNSWWENNRSWNGELEKVLDVCEERLSKSKYLAGDDCTMADMQYIPYLVYFMRTPKAAAVTPRPRANAWWDDIASGMQLLKLQKAWICLIKIHSYQCQRDKKRVALNSCVYVAWMHLKFALSVLWFLF